MPLPGKKQSEWISSLLAGSPDSFLKDVTCQRLHTKPFALWSILKAGSRTHSPRRPRLLGGLRTAPKPGRQGPERLRAGAAARTCGTRTSSMAASAPRPGSSENRKRWARNTCPRRSRPPSEESVAPGRAGSSGGRRAARLRARGPGAGWAASPAPRGPVGPLKPSARKGEHPSGGGAAAPGGQTRSQATGTQNTRPARHAGGSRLQTGGAAGSDAQEAGRGGGASAARPSQHGRNPASVKEGPAGAEANGGRRAAGGRGRRQPHAQPEAREVVGE